MNSSKETEPKVVNARDLYDFLGVEIDFETWIEESIKILGFKEGVDFTMFYDTERVENEKKSPSEFFMDIDNALEMVLNQKSLDSGRKELIWYILKKGGDEQFFKEIDGKATAALNKERFQKKSFDELLAIKAMDFATSLTSFNIKNESISSLDEIEKDHIDNFSQVGKMVREQMGKRKK